MEHLSEVPPDYSSVVGGERNYSAIEQLFVDRRTWGLLAAVNLHNCNPEKIRDPATIRRFVAKLCKVIDMEPQGLCHVERFGEGDLLGNSMFQFIKTSSITGHFDEKRANAAFIDAFSCKCFDPWLFGDFAMDFFNATDYTLRLTLRR